MEIYLRNLKFILKLFYLINYYYISTRMKSIWYKFLKKKSQLQITTQFENPKKTMKEIRKYLKMIYFPKYNIANDHIKEWEERQRLIVILLARK